VKKAFRSASAHTPPLLFLFQRLFPTSTTNNKVKPIRSDAKQQQKQKARRGGREKAAEQMERER